MYSKSIYNFQGLLGEERLPFAGAMQPDHQRQIHGGWQIVAISYQRRWRREDQNR